MHIDSGALDGITRKPVENERKSVSRYKGIDRFIYEMRGGFMGISFSNIGTVGREQLITSGSNGEPNWSYIPSKGKSTKKVNNRTYQFADEKIKKQIAYMSGYYLQTVPQSVKAAWQETLEETGFNPFQTDVTSILTQLSVEQDFLTGGDDNIFGETKESCLAAIDKVLERIENPLAAVTEERAAYLQQEKEFYTVLASKIRE